MFIKALLTAQILFVSVISFAQTAGISNVTAIESIANGINVNKELIANHKRSLLDLEAAWQKKIQSLRDEINALYKERDAIIADMKVGARCSQCNGWKSEFEKKGENFEKHLGEVKGYAIPASTVELEMTRKQYAEKIALKKVQLQNLEKGDKAILKVRSDISQLEKQNESYCSSITTHSKSYETTVYSEAKGKHEQWIASLMNYASAILIADDKITIAEAKIIKYNIEFAQASKELREQIRKEFKETEDKKLASISANEKRIETIQTEKEEYLNPLETQLGDLVSQMNTLKVAERNSTISASTRDSLQKEILLVDNKIKELDKTILQYNAKTKSKIDLINSDIKLLKDEIKQIAIDLPKKQDEETAKVKLVYDKKIKEAKEMINRYSSELGTAKSEYSNKAASYKKDNITYIDIIILESNRMLVAGQKVSCSVWNDVRGKVASNWNQVFPCVDNVATKSKPYSTNVFNSYCKGTSTSAYLVSYKAFLGALNAEDLDSVKKSSNVTWFESLMN